MSDLVRHPDEVRMLARGVAARVAPAELPLFSTTADKFLTDPAEVLTPPSHRDEPLGFGAEAAVVLALPVVLEVARRVVDTLLDSALGAAGEELAARVRRLLGRSSGSAAEVDRLTPEQLADVRSVAERSAVELQVEPERARALADAVVASLAVS